MASVAVLLAACEYREPGMSSADVQAFAAEHPGITQTCVDDVRWGRRNWGSVLEDADCFEMLPPQRWHGLWDHGWEWTNFCPEPANTCAGTAQHGGIWLTFGKDAYRGGKLPDGIYWIEFIGRRTKVPGYFGHLSQYDHLMVVDKMISMQLIKAEPGP